MDVFNTENDELVKVYLADTLDVGDSEAAYVAMTELVSRLMSSSSTDVFEIRGLLREAWTTGGEVTRCRVVALVAIDHNHFADIIEMAIRHDPAMRVREAGLRTAGTSRDPRFLAVVAFALFKEPFMSVREIAEEALEIIVESALGPDLAELGT